MENKKDILEDLYIFEMANSHQGSVEHGLDIIHEMGKIARNHNIKAAVKLQYRNLDTFIHPDYKGRTRALSHVFAPAGGRGQPHHAPRNSAGLSDGPQHSSSKRKRPL